MKVTNKGAFIHVGASEAEVMAFKRQWPCNGMPERSFWAEFQTSNGDLVDMTDRFRKADDAAVNALVEDLKQHAKKRLNLEHW
jgi:hypothetical protein